MKTNVVKILLINMAACVILAVSGCEGCGSRVPGTYSDPTGGIVVDFKSGGTATITFAGETATCPYTSTGDQVVLNCQGQPGRMAFTFDKEGALVGPPGSILPPLKRK
jgi:hypothetical protein